MSWELPDVQTRFRKEEGTRDQIANILRILKKQGNSRKNIHLCFLDYIKASDSVDHNKKWKILQEMGKPDRLSCLLLAFHSQCLPLPVMLGINGALGLPAQEGALGDVTLPRYQVKVKRQVTIGHGTTDWFKIGKGEHQGCMLSPCLLFNLYTEYIM